MHILNISIGLRELNTYFIPKVEATCMNNLFLTLVLLYNLSGITTDQSSVNVMFY